MKTFIIIMMMIFSFNSMAEDVYNFYFQKNAEAAKSSETNVASPQPVQELHKEVKQDKQEKNTLKKMELGFYRSWAITTAKRSDGYGKSYDDDPMRDSFAVMGSYRFNRYVAAEGGFYMYTGWNENSQDYKALDTSKSFDGSLGLSITPLHLKVFGYELLEVGVIGGVMTMGKFDVKQDNTNSQDIKSGSAKKIYTAYLGPRAALNLTQELGIVFDLKTASNLGAMTSLGLRYRF